jgi:hypothetical protein
MMGSLVLLAVSLACFVAAGIIFRALRRLGR